MWMGRPLAVVDQGSGEEPAEVVRCEADLGELRVRGDQGLGGVEDDLAHPADRQGPRGTALHSLEEVGQRLAPGAFALVVARADRDCPALEELLGVLRRAGRPEGVLGRLDQPQGEGDPGSPGEPTAPLGVAVGEVGDGPAGLVQAGRLPSFLAGLPRLGGQLLQQAAHAVLVVGPGVAADVGELLGDEHDDLVDRGGRQLPERPWRPVRDWRRLRCDLDEMPVRQRRGGLGSMAADSVRGQVWAHVRPDSAIGHRTPPQ
jgi:hypothetical protein